MNDEQTLVFIAGISGAIGTTVCTGLALAEFHDLVSKGMMTESYSMKSTGIKLTPITNIKVDSGWDLDDRDLLLSTRKHAICPPHLMGAAQERLKNIQVRDGISSASHISIEEWLHAETKHIRSRVEKHSAKVAIVVNLCPTEPSSAQIDTDPNWRDPGSLHLNQRGVTTSRLYFRLAIEAGAHYINFTPNRAETESLKTMAKEKGICFCGRDGKTGQTFLKTVIAPALRDKNLHIDGWFSTNLLGNNDGLTLSNRDASETKIDSKKQCLESILGYTPSGDEEYGHQVNIHYYPPRGDAKEAWDNIDFSGFLGSRMQLKLNWLGQDSMLAAPCVIDLARIISFATQCGQVGELPLAAYFFKDPLHSDRAVPHATTEQLDYLRYQLRKLAQQDN